MHKASWLALLLCLLGSCSHRSVGAQDGGGDVPVGQTDRLSIHGTFCPGLDPDEASLPLKLLFVIDTSQSMNVNDPPDSVTAKTARRKAIEDVVTRFAANDAVELAIMRFSQTKQVLTKNSEGVAGFTNDPKALAAALAQLDAAGGVSDHEGAWATAYSVLSTDMSRMGLKDPYGLQHGTYLVLFLADGVPYPQIQSEADWATVSDAVKQDLLGPGGSTKDHPQYNTPAKTIDRVKEVMALPALYGVSALRLHTFFLEGNQPDYGAAALLKQIASVGQGTYRTFASAEQFDFQSIKYATAAGWPQLKILLASNTNLRPTVTGGALDSDGDGLDDAQEAQLGTNPGKLDTDQDGYSDGVEQLLHKNPLDSTDADCATRQDSDGDGLLDCEERLAGTHALLMDTDADGYPDRMELLGGTSPTQADDVSDLDHDGVQNGDELREHTTTSGTEGSARAGWSYRYKVKQTVGEQICHAFDVDNIQLAGPPMDLNTIILHAGQMLGDDQGDHGIFRVACVRARVGPAPLSVQLPQSAWKPSTELDLTAHCVSP